MRQIDPKSLRYLKLTTKDIRLSKVAKRDRTQPCSDEFDSYLAALEAFGEAKIPPMVLRSLGDCMDATVCLFRIIVSLLFFCCRSLEFDDLTYFIIRLVVLKSQL